jgi:hypothetical protein
MPLGFSYASKTLQACVSNQYKAPCKISDYRAQRFLSFRGGALLGLWLDLWLDLWFKWGKDKVNHKVNHKSNHKILGITALFYMYFRMPGP